MTDQNGPSATYIHGTAISERSRLDDLNALTNRSFIDYLNLSAAAEVADLGCGPGTLEAEIGARYPGVRLIGIERSESYCATARQRTAHLSGAGAPRNWRRQTAADFWALWHRQKGTRPPFPTEMWFGRAEMAWQSRVAGEIRA